MRNIILGFILLVQLTVWFVMDPPWSEKKARTETVDEKKLSAISLDQVGRIIIDPPGEGSLTLEKANDRWTIREVQGFPAMDTKVTKLLGELEKLPKGGLRSSNALLHETYEVDPLRGTLLRLETGDAVSLGELVVGKRDIQGVQGTFVRKKDEQDVYVIPARELGSLLSVDPKNWYDPSMMDVSYREQARMSDLSGRCYRLEIESNAPNPEDGGALVSKRFVYEKVDAATPEGEAHWKVVEPAGKEGMRLNALLLKSLVGSVLNSRALELVGPATKPEFGLDDPDALRLKVTARFRGDEGETVRTLEIGNEIPKEKGAAQFRYAKTTYPGDALKQRFVFGLSASTPVFFERGPEALELKEPKKDQKGGN